VFRIRSSTIDLANKQDRLRRQGRISATGKNENRTDGAKSENSSLKFEGESSIRRTRNEQGKATSRTKESRRRKKHRGEHYAEREERENKSYRPAEKNEDPPTKPQNKKKKNPQPHL